MELGAIEIRGNIIKAWRYNVHYNRNGEFEPRDVSETVIKCNNITMYECVDGYVYIHLRGGGHFSVSNPSYNLGLLNCIKNAINRLVVETPYKVGTSKLYFKWQDNKFVKGVRLKLARQAVLGT